MKFPTWWRGRFSKIEAMLVGVYYREHTDLDRPCVVLVANERYL